MAVTGQFRPLVGGTEIHAAHLGRVWSARGHEVEIWTRRLEASHPRLEREGGTVLRRLGWASSSSALRVRRIEKVHFSLSLLARLSQRRNEYDVVIVHNALYPAVIASYAKRITGRPLVIRNASTGVTSDFRIWGSLTHRALRVLKHSADAVVVTNSQGLREAVACGFPESRVHRIPNGLDPGPPPSKGPARRPARVFYVGGLRPEKRVDLLLRAWALAGSPGELLLAGEGPQRVMLEALARRLDISPVFLGNVTEPRLLLTDADVFVLPSDAEGMSNALLEAMAAGCACVATYVGGNVDCLAPENVTAPEAGTVVKASAGWLVPCGDERALALALGSLAADSRSREEIAGRARARILAEYNIEETSTAYLRLFESVSM